MASSNYAARIARGEAAYFAAHPGASREDKADRAAAHQFARGHGATGEHGVTTQRIGNNQYVVSFRDAKFAAKAARTVERLEAATGGARVTLAVTDKGGNVKELFANRGHSKGITSEELAARIARDGISNVIEAALAAEYKDRRGPTGAGGPAGGVGPAFDGRAIRDYQLIVQ